MPKLSNDVPSNYSNNKSSELIPTFGEAISGALHQAQGNINKLTKQGQPSPQQNSDCIHPALRYLSLLPKTDKPSFNTDNSSPKANKSSPAPSSTGAYRVLPNMLRLSTNASAQSLQHPSLSLKTPPNSACQATSNIHSPSKNTISHDQRHPSTIDNHSPLKNQRFFCQDQASNEGSTIDSDYDVYDDSFTIIKSSAKK